LEKDIQLIVVFELMCVVPNSNQLDSFTLFGTFPLSSGVLICMVENIVWVDLILMEIGKLIVIYSWLSTLARIHESV
jgi:hypothetical protein